MPLIVVGADTRAGETILEVMDPGEREIRVFVTDEAKGLDLRGRGFKVATGDVSDEGHVEAAAMRCFSAVLLAEASTDDRERSFAHSPEEILQGWSNAVANSEVTRVIWVIEGAHPVTRAREVVAVDPGEPDLAGTVARLDDAHSIS
jgi:putative NADH-flavin reductase